MTVYTYFDANQTREGDGELIRLWRLSWEHRGWETRILTPRSAKDHPRYREIVPSIDPDALRWMAFAQVGGGWFSDYDCINYSFSPNQPEARILAPGFETSWPSLLWATSEGAADIATSVMTENNVIVFHQGLEYVCSPVGQGNWETAPVVQFSRQAIFRHLGCEVSPARVVTSCDRRF